MSHLAALVAVSLALGACGGAASPAPAATPAQPGATANPEPAPTPEGSEAAMASPTADAPAIGGPAAAPGTGTLDLGSRVFDLTVDECMFQDGGTVSAEGATSEGYTFEFLQFFLNGEWSQSQVEIDTGPTMVFVIRNSASADAQPATVDGANIQWTEEFRELDVAANSFVFSGEGTLNLTCP